MRRPPGKVPDVLSTLPAGVAPAGHLAGGRSAARPGAATAPIAAAVRRNERRVEFPRILIVCFTSLHLEASCPYAYANQVELRKRLSPFFFPALSNKNSTSANEYG